MKNILIAGVGGQGTLLASMIFGQAALSMDCDVKLSEVHGMAQRGGSVITYVRIGDKGEKVYSPVIDECGADILIAFEELEGLRWLPFLNPEKGAVYMNTQRILPMPVITGAAEYPNDIPEKIRSLAAESVFVDALTLAREAGNPKAVNLVMLGAVSADIAWDLTVWDKAIEAAVKPKFIDLNKKAFELGRREAQ